MQVIKTKCTMVQIWILFCFSTRANVLACWS